MASFGVIAAFSQLQQGPWGAKLAAVVAFTLMSAAYLRLANRRWAGHAARLAAAAPVLALNFAVPLVFHRYDEPVTVAFSAFMVTWLGNFKAFAAAGGRGPLALEPWSLLQFWVLYVLPIVPASPPDAAAFQRRRSQGQHLDSPGTGLQLLLRWLLKAGLTAAVVHALLLPGLPPLARSCLYVLGLYTMLGVVMDGPAALVLRPLALRLAPHFLPPWESRSLADFWGLHWNQAAGNALRTTLYDPIVQGSLAARPPGAAAASRRRSARLAAAAPPPGEARRLAGMAASFFASGAAHELIFWYVQGSPTQHLAWLWFFAGQVPLIVAERLIMRRLKAAGQVPPHLLRIAVTLGVLQLSAHWLFFLPAERAGVPARFADSMRQSFAALAAAPAALAVAARGG